MSVAFVGTASGGRFLHLYFDKRLAAPQAASARMRDVAQFSDNVVP